jgi:Bacteriophage replication gene A protein (GPA)
MQLQARAEEHEIAAQAIACIGKVRAQVGAYGRTEHAPQTLQFLQGTLNGIATRYGAKPVAKGTSLEGCIGRMTDPMWWRRNLRRALLRQNENSEHALGHIRRRGQCYVSDFAMGRKAARSKVNRATLEALEVVNENGLALNLAEVADKSVSNPKLRRAELMTRCRGFEETAAFMGHCGIFLTLTCPSRFHRFNAQGQQNKNWTDALIKEGQAYLSGVWAKIRAAWNRNGYAPYGFRVAEPHHDGCPHWHILLFVDKAQAGWFEAARFVGGRNDHGAGVVGIAGRYALQESPGEPGAIKHRFTCKRIDPSQGSATGYIAKYIAKNIDGLTEQGDGVGLDFASGTTAQKGAARVRTWASVHGIRQFQQIGGPSVTVWRELRKIKTEQQNDLFEAPRAAADRALWSLFWVLQGGPEVARKNLTLKPAYMAAKTGKYGDDIERVWGVQAADGCALQTRLHEWTIQRAGLAAVDLYEAVRIDDRAIEAGALAWVQAAGFDSIPDFQAREACPWTGVNNCTQDEKFSDEADLKRDLSRGQGCPPYTAPDGFPANQRSFHVSSLEFSQSRRTAPTGGH